MAATMYHCSLRTTFRSFSNKRLRTRREIQTLTINAGSTTLKYALYNVQEKSAPALLASGLVDRVGKPDVSITHNKKVVQVASSVENHADALKQVIPLLPTSDSPIDCIGHRVVHGGSVFSQPTVLTPQVVSTIEEAIKD